MKKKIPMSLNTDNIRGEKDFCVHLFDGNLSFRSFPTLPALPLCTAGISSVEPAQPFHSEEGAMHFWHFKNDFECSTQLNFLFIKWNFNLRLRSLSKPSFLQQMKVINFIPCW